MMKVAAFDMDNTILRSSFIESAANVYGFKGQLTVIRENKNPFIRTKLIAGLLKGHDIAELLKLTDSIDIVDGLTYIIAELKKKDYTTGIISDSYDFVTNHLKRKYGFDFNCSNQLEFVNGFATGNVKIPRIFAHSKTSLCDHEYCKLNALLNVCRHYDVSLEDTLMIGDGKNDICCIQYAGIGISFCSTNKEIDSVAKYIIKKQDFGVLTAILNE